MAGMKRKYGQESPDQLYTNKSRSKPSVEARVDPTYGQRSAIPGLDDDTTMEGEEEWLNYDDDMDAMAYLRAVRQEATGIPNLLVAPKQPSEEYSRDIYEDGVGDYRGYYEDGAYYTSDLVPASSDDIAEEGEVGTDPQLAYFDSILTRFENLRVQLSQTPPAEAVNKLGTDHPTHVGKLNTAAAKWWRWRMKTIDPLPVQIASMDKSTVLRLLGLLTGGTLLKNGMAVEVSVSRWAWGLLARLPDRGELTSEEIGVVRELGKKAVLVGMGFREDQQWGEGIDEVEAGYEQDDEYREEGSYVNQEEVRLDMGGDLDDVEVESMEHATNDTPRQIGPQLPTARNNTVENQDVTTEPNGNNNATNNLEVRQTEGESSIANEKTDNSELEESILDADLLDDVAAAKARILASLNTDQIVEAVLQEEEAVPSQEVQDSGAEHAPVDPEILKWNTKATVDMIITVAGEIFGQRDLLEFRSVWG